MAEDPALPLTDVQFVLGHAQLTTTQIYLTPRKEDVIRRVLAHHAEQTRRAVRAAHVRPRRPATGRRRWTCCSGTARRDLRPARSRMLPGHRPLALRTCVSGFPRAAVTGVLAGDLANREAALGRLTCAPFVSDNADTQKKRVLGLKSLLDWLEDQPGDTGRNGGWPAEPTPPARDGGRCPARWLQDRGLVAECAAGAAVRGPADGDQRRSRCVPRWAGSWPR